MNKRIPVAAHLSDADYRTLLVVYANHNSSMGFEMRKNYTASHMVRVEKNEKEGCLNVHYVDGEWWKYYPNGTWG